MPQSGAFLTTYAMHCKCPCRGHFQLYMQDTGDAPVRGIFSYTCKALEVLLQEAFPATHVRHWKCSCRGHFQLYIQATGNAPIRGISNYICKALEMLL
jgi:hypothetical protein